METRLARWEFTGTLYIRTTHDGEETEGMCTSWEITKNTCLVVRDRRSARISMPGAQLIV